MLKSRSWIIPLALLPLSALLFTGCEPPDAPIEMSPVQIKAAQMKNYATDIHHDLMALTLDSSLARHQIMRVEIWMQILYTGAWSAINELSRPAPDLSNQGRLAALEEEIKLIHTDMSASAQANAKIEQVYQKTQRLLTLARSAQNDISESAKTQLPLDPEWHSYIQKSMVTEQRSQSVYNEMMSALQEHAGNDPALQKIAAAVDHAREFSLGLAENYLEGQNASTTTEASWYARIKYSAMRTSGLRQLMGEWLETELTPLFNLPPVILNQVKEDEKEEKSCYKMSKGDEAGTVTPVLTLVTPCGALQNPSMPIPLPPPTPKL